MRCRTLIGLSIGICLLAAPELNATTATTTFTVTALVSTACTVSASNLSFGTYDPLNASPSDATTTIVSQCSPSTVYHIRLNKGLSTGTTSERSMSGPGGSGLAYWLYRDAAHTLNWGEVDGVDTVDGTGTGAIVNSTVYGRIPQLQSVAAGTYSDTITVTISF